MERGWMPTVAGILSIITGAISLIGAVFIALIGTVVLLTPGAQGDFDGNFPEFPIAVLWIVFVPYLVISVLAIVGGVFALRKRVWGLALTGAICAILSLWGWWLGVAAVVLVILGKPEFDRLAAPSYPPPPPVTPPPPPTPPPSY